MKKNSDFQRLYSRGKSAVTPCLVLYCRRSKADGCRVGYTVSTKLGHAVVRNRVRRRLREVYRLHSSEFRPGFDMVVVARGRCIEAEFSQLESCFLDAAGKLGMLKEDAI